MDLSKTIKIVIDVVSNAKDSLSKTAKELNDIGKAGREVRDGIGGGTAALAAAERAYANVEKKVAAAKKELQETGTVSRKTANEIKKAGDAANKASSDYSKLAKGVAGVFTFASIAYGVNQLIRLSDTYTQLDGRLRLVTSSTEEAAEVHEKLYEIAQRSRSAFEATADVYNRFAQAVKGQGVGQDELLSMTETLQKAFVISGAKPEEAAAAMVQLSQGFSAGVLRGEEFNSVIEQGGRVIDMLTDYLKVDRGELRAMANDGKLTSDILRNALAVGAAKVNDEFGMMPETVGQASVKLKNAFAEVISGANKSSGATSEIAKAINDVTDTVNDNRSEIVSLFADIIRLAGQAASAVINIGNSIRGIAAVARGDLDFFEFAGMNPEKLKAWTREYNSAAGQVKAQIRKTNAEILKYSALGVDTAPWENELAGLERKLTELALAEAKEKKVSEGRAKTSKAAAVAAGEVAQKTKLTSKEMDTLTGKLLPLVEAEKNYKEQLAQIALAEQAGQFSGDKAQNAALASQARNKAAAELEKVRQATSKSTAGARAASSAWSGFSNAVRLAEAEMKALEQALEMKGLESTIEAQNKILGNNTKIAGSESEKIAIIDRQIAKYQELAASVPESSKSKSSDTEYARLQEKINGLQIERNRLIVEANNAKIQGLSEEKILSLELQKLSTETYSDDYQKAVEQLRLDKEIINERKKLKEYQLQDMQAEGSKATASDIITAKNDLLELNIELERVGVEGRKNLAVLKMDEIGDSWRRNAESVAEYRAAVQEALASGAIDKQAYDELMVKSGDDTWAAFSAGAIKSFDQIRTDAELMYDIGLGLADQLSSGFMTAFDGMISGSKSASEAFTDMARSMISWLLQIIAKQIILQALQSMSMFADGGQIGATQKLADGGGVAGFSPNDKADNIPIWATAGEFMQPVKAVKHYGLAFMEAIRTLRLPRADAMSMLRGLSLGTPMPSFKLAMGGPVPSANMAGGGGGANTTVKGGDLKLKVVNAINSGDMVGGYLKSSDGETVLLNIIKRNGSTVRTLIGG